jgi:serine/threonine-protein kinase
MENARMKYCPQCNTGFPDNHTTCPTHGGSLSEIIELKPGMLIRNTYRIERKLGQGGFGTVYLAEQILMGEQRALKFLSRQYCQDETSTARFRREVRTLHQVRNCNVVDCGDLEQAEDGTLFFSMEYVDGPDLGEFIDKHPRPFDVKLALEITRGIALGLGAAHAKGLVHRDIKPQNILMAWENDVWIPKIADFGIVATKESRTTSRGVTSASLLTWTYAAPEQWHGMRSAELDGRTDIYALGGVLFEMLTGQTVFDAENHEGWMFQHLQETPKPPSSLRPELANWKGLDALVLRMLAKDRELRHRDIAELLSLLDAVEYLPSGQRRETVREDSWKREQTVQSKPTPLAPNLDPKRSTERGRGVAIGRFVVSVLVVISALAAYAVLSRGFRWNGSGAQPQPQSQVQPQPNPPNAIIKGDNRTSSVSQPPEDKSDFSASELAGTTWAEQDSDGPPCDYTFNANGTLRYSCSPSSMSYTNATWKKNGNSILMVFSDGFAKRQGSITGNHMEGKGWNAAGGSCTWTMDKE